jgi:hypothetical protein
VGNFERGDDFIDRSVQPTGTRDVDAAFLNSVLDGLDSAHDELNNHEGRIDTLETGVGGFETAIGDLGEADEALDTRLDTLESWRTGTVAPTLTGFDERLDNLEAGGGEEGGGAVGVSLSESTIVSAATMLDLSSAFTLSESPAGEANIGINFGTDAGEVAPGDHEHEDLVAWLAFNQPGGFAGLDEGNGRVLSSVLGTGTPSASNFLRGDRSWAPGPYLSTSHKEGLLLEYLTDNSLQVTPGSAYVPSLGGVLEVPAPLSLSSLVMAVNTWFYVYLYRDGSNNPQIELSTTAPTVPYRGWGRTKTGDNSRRYLGCIRTGSVANVMHQFVDDGNRVTYIETINASPFRVVSLGGVLNTNNTVSCSAVAPPHSRRVRAIAQATANGTVWFGLPGIAADYAWGQSYAGYGMAYFGDLELDSSQQFRWRLNGSQINIDINAFYDPR